MTGPRPTGWAWLERGLTSADILVPGSDAHDHLYHFVDADRDGPMTRRLLTYAGDARPAVRRTLFELLDSLGLRHRDWPLLADAAESALTDPDPRVRQSAASLLGRTAASGRVLTALDATTDPDTRIALADALNRHVPARLRSDPVPAVRVLATLAAYPSDDPPAWPALDAEIRADLDACAGVLEAGGRITAGERWAWAMVSLDREEDCLAWAQRLAGPAENPTINAEGVRLARRAMRIWRAAPARLTPMLVGLLDREDARRTLTASRTATRLAADDLVPLLDDPAVATALGSVGDRRAVPRLVDLMLAGSDHPRLGEALRALACSGADPEAPVAAARQILAGSAGSGSPTLALRVLSAFGPAAASALPELIARIEGAGNDTPDHEILVLGRIGPAAEAAVPSIRGFTTQCATSALLRITGDRSVAEDYLAGRPEELRHGRLAAELLTWLAGHGGLTVRQHRQARSLFRVRGFAQSEVAGAVWLHEGPAVAAELVAELPQYLTCGVRGHAALRTLIMMGAHARPVLGDLDRFATGRRRSVYYSGSDEDVEMRVDETMVAEAIAARQQIAGAGQ